MKRRHSVSARTFLVDLTLLTIACAFLVGLIFLNAHPAH